VLSALPPSPFRNYEKEILKKKRNFSFFFFFFFADDLLKKKDHYQIVSNQLLTLVRDRKRDKA
jgi:hypothetical protein